MSQTEQDMLFAVQEAFEDLAGQAVLHEDTRKRLQLAADLISKYWYEKLTA